MKRLSVFCLLVAILISGCATVDGESLSVSLELGSPFVNDMILQRQMPAPVWGWATTGTKITVSFAGQTKSATADEKGKWMVTLDPLKASLVERELTVTANTEESITRTGVLVGEVWFSSGQSNMDWVAGKSMCQGIASEISRAKEDVPIREYQVDTGSSVFPQSRTASKGGWKRAKEAGGFSALSLSFAYKLHKELGVPIGLLRSTHGATPIETWTPYEGFGSHPKLQDIAARIKQSDPGSEAGSAGYTQFYEDLRQWQIDSKEIMDRGGNALNRPALPGIASDWKGAGRMFNKKVNGMIPYAIRGMIWCQGTSNAGDGRIYAAKMEALVNGIRAKWGYPNLPFYFTQQQCYGAPDPNAVGHADLRESQRLFFMNNVDKNVGMALQHDLNSARPGGIHNFNKLHPGYRMARWALAHQYGKKIAYTGPIYKSHTIKGNEVRVQFDQPGLGGGLMVGSKGMAKDYRTPDAYVEPAKPTPGDQLKHFRLAGKDRVWHAAEAVIKGNEVVVTSKAVAEPVGVQYCYSAVPMGANLYNEVGLPALAFAYFDGKQLFQEDLRPKAPPVTGEPVVRKRNPYVGVMTPLRHGAVVQRDKPIPVWGFAVPGDKVTVSFAGQSKSAVADEFDRWRVTLDPVKASAKNRDMKFRTAGGASRTIGNIVVGDLWMITGTRSIGEMVFNSRDKNARIPEEMPLLREFRARTKTRRHRTMRKRRMEIGGGKYSSRWCTANVVDGNIDITAVAYHFAQAAQEEGVPIGIINLGCDNPPLTWISYEGMQTAAGFEKEREDINLQYPNTDSCKRSVESYIEDLKEYCNKVIAIQKAGGELPVELAESVPAFPQPFYNQWSDDTETATHTYNFCIAPNTPFAVRGMVWIPGQKNLGKDLSLYSSALVAYATSLPQTYDQETVPFIYAHPSKKLAPDVVTPEIKNGARVSFDAWPKSMKEIASQLGKATSTRLATGK